MTRRIIIDMDTPIGNKLYWFLKELMTRFPDDIKELESDEI